MSTEEAEEQVDGAIQAHPLLPIVLPLLGAGVFPEQDAGDFAYAFGLPVVGDPFDPSPEFPKESLDQRGCPWAKDAELQPPADIAEEVAAGPLDVLGGLFEPPFRQVADEVQDLSIGLFHPFFDLVLLGLGHGPEIPPG